MSIERVVVMMPFGGDSTEAQRRAILDYLRIKYILNKPEVRSSQDIEYAVTAVNLQAGNIQAWAIKELLKADLTVFLMTEENVNVAFELAVRCLRDVPILIVKGDERKLVPIYLVDQAHIKYDAPSMVEEQISSTSKSSLPSLNWESDIPEGLAQAIDAQDHTMIGNIRDALHQRARQRDQRSPITEMMLSWAADQAVVDLVKTGLYERWTTYSPCSTVQIRWKARSVATEYRPEDVDGDPVVIDHNRDFCALYNFDNALEASQLTLSSLLRKVEAYVDPADFKAFVDDQQRLTEEIVFKGGYAQTKFALHINQDHPRPEMRGRSFMPCLVGKDRVALDLSAPHSVYLIVVYADVTDAHVRQQPSE